MFVPGIFGGLSASSLSLGSFGQPSFAPSPPRHDPNVALRQIGQAVLGLRRGVEGVSGALNGVTRVATLSGGSQANSGSGLNLNLFGEQSEVRSFEDVSTTNTSILDREPEWAIGSTSEVLISGIYDGSIGTETLIFDIERGGVVGQDVVFFRVLDAQGNFLGNRVITPSYEPGEEVALMFGVTISFGEGVVEEDDALRVNVRDLIDTDLRPNRPFNGIGNDTPHLDNGLVITDGSFTINGQAVAINEDDTLNQVMNRINNLVSGITASYDPNSERVKIESTEPGPNPIELADDTSGFLAAMKLDAAIPELGSFDDLRATMANVARFAGVSAGSIDINGVTLQVNPALDSLQDILDRINSDVPQVTAAYDSGLERVEVRNSSGDLVLENDTSGLLDSLTMSEGTFSANLQSGRPRTLVPDRRRLRRELQDLSESLAAVFALEFKGTAGARASSTQAQLRTALEQTLSGLGVDVEGGSARTDYGLKLDFEREDGDVLRFDDGLLEKALVSDGTGVVDFLLGRAGNDNALGLVERLEGIADSLARSLAGSLGPGEALALDLLA